VVPRIDSTWGDISAADAPCTIRAISRKVVLGASPHASEARVNSATPSTNSRRLPKMSPSRPPVMRLDENASA
jgi:hypothetical protein